MITVNKVVPSNSTEGDATNLQPASPLSDEVRSQLFDEFTPHELPRDTAVTAHIVWVAVLLAALLAIIAVYIVKQVKPYETAEATNKK